MILLNQSELSTPVFFIYISAIGVHLQMNCFVKKQRSCNAERITLYKRIKNILRHFVFIPFIVE